MARIALLWQNLLSWWQNNRLSYIPCYYWVMLSPDVSMKVHKTTKFANRVSTVHVDEALATHKGINLYMYIHDICIYIM
jgi:hypothetical protein